MRLFSFLAEDGARIGAIRNGTPVDLSAADGDLPRCMKSLLEQGTQGLDRAAAALEKAPEIDGEIDYLPVVPRPGKIICVGLNYADHAKESGMAPPEEPVIFNKFPTAANAHRKPVVLPAISDQVDYEAELVVVIGTRAKNVPEAEALKVVAGYTCGNDISARDWQRFKPGKQWLLGKTFDTFAPMGPHLVTADEIGDPGNLQVSLRLNGETMQQSNTNQLIFSVPQLIAYISQVAALEPGDVLFTGTPPGVGFARTPPVYLKPGDKTEVEIEKIGVLENDIVAA